MVSPLENLVRNQILDFDSILVVVILQSSLKFNILALSTQILLFESWISRFVEILVVYRWRMHLLITTDFGIMHFLCRYVLSSIMIMVISQFFETLRILLRRTILRLFIWDKILQIFLGRVFSEFDHASLVRNSVGFWRLFDFAFNGTFMDWLIQHGCVDIVKWLFHFCNGLTWRHLIADHLKRRLKNFFLQILRTHIFCLSFARTWQLWRFFPF